MSLVTLRAEVRDLVRDEYINDTELDRLIERATLKLQRDFVRDGLHTPRQMLASESGKTTPTGYPLPPDFQRMRTVILEGHRARYASPDKVDVESKPDDADVTLIYYAKLALLTESTSNWVYDVAKDLYLYATALQWGPWRKDTEHLSMWGELYDDAFDGVCEANARVPRGSWVRWQSRPWKGLYTIEGSNIRFG